MKTLSFLRLRINLDFPFDFSIKNIREINWPLVAVHLRTAPISKRWSICSLIFITSALDQEGSEGTETCTTSLEKGSL